MCSMKWATPASAADSRREPARTYAAMETERAPGTRELITRGPAGSAVRSNIAAMVQEGVCRPDTVMPRPAAGASNLSGISDDGVVQPGLHEEDHEGDGHDPHQGVDVGEFPSHDLDDDIGHEGSADTDRDAEGQRHED